MDEDIKLENLIEKKFRNILLETKIISYIIQKDHKVAFLIDENVFTIQAYQLFLDISRKNKMEYPKQIFWQSVKSIVSEDDLPIYTNYFQKIYKADLENVTSKNIEKLCNKLLELQHSRKIIHAISDTIEDVSKFNLEEVKFRFKNVLLNTDIKQRESIDYLQDFQNRRNHLKEIAKNPKKLAGIPTGIKEFDELSGGLMRTEFGVIIAETGKGKSITLGNIGSNAYYKNYNVVIATFEMTNRQYAYRFDSRNARIDFSKFRKAELDIFDYEKWEQKMESFKKVKNNFLRIVRFQRGSTIEDVKNEMYKIQGQEKKEIDLLILDYINLVSVKSKFGTNKSWENQTDAAWEMKELCQDFNDGLGLPIWTANQLTDEGSKAKRITTSHMKYARGISEVAPVIVSLSQSEEARIVNVMEMWILKCRDFPKQKKPIILYPNFKFMAIDDSGRRRKENK